MSRLHRMWNDDAGFVVSTELVLIATILVIGMIVGLATVRNAVVQELGDTAMAVGNLNHSYQYSGAVTCRAGTSGSSFIDQPDFCDGDGTDPEGEEPAGISVQEPPSREGIQ